MTKGLLKLATCAAAVLFGSACLAQSTPFLAAGSTGAYNAIGLASTVSPCSTTITGVSGTGSAVTVTYTPASGCTFAPAVTSPNPSNISVVGTGTAADTTNVVITAISTDQFTYNSTFSGSASTGITGITPTCSNLSNNADIASATDVYDWTQSSSDHILQGADSRPGSITAQNAPAWVIWQTSNPDVSTSTATAVCAYLNADSIVGLRLFFASSAGGAAGTISFPGGCASSIASDDNGSAPVPLIPLGITMPATVCSAINGLAFNAAPSDVRAEDGAFQMSRICGTYATSGTGYGSDCDRSGSGAFMNYLSGIHGSSKSAQAIDFAIAGADPVSGVTIVHSAAGTDGHPWVSLNAGGQALLVLVNTSDTSTSGFGSATLTNISRTDLGRVFVGAATRTRDIIPVSGLASKGFTSLVREPMSGTYTTYENQVTRTIEFNHSVDQVTNNGGGQQLYGPGLPTCPASGWTFFQTCPISATTNQMDAKRTSDGFLKVRVIGTGEMVACIAEVSCGDGTNEDQSGNALSNQIGFTFFSFANVKPCTTGPTCKYLTVDGADPLGKGGVLPTCTAPCPTGVNLANISNGTYPIWNILRVITTAELGGYTISGGKIVCATGATVCSLVQQMQASYSQIPDLVSINNMQAFRSHWASGAVTETGSINFTGHNGEKKYGTGITGTPCGFAPITGEQVIYECGLDAKGARFLVQQELDANTDFSVELTSIQQ